MSQRNNNSRREYTRELNFEGIAKRGEKFAEHIANERDGITDTLLAYEPYQVARDEIDRSTDLLTSLAENREYFRREVGPVASFLPSNQPLYATTCFGIVPSFMASEVHLKAPRGMDHFFPRLVQRLDLEGQFPNIHLHQGRRDDFVNTRSAYRHHADGKLETATDAVIFTGTPEKAHMLRREFHKNVLFIVNGAGHNPIVVAENADFDAAVASALSVQLYNQGQDCAAPNSILVHAHIYDIFILKLSAALQKIKVGPYENRENLVGPISRNGDLARIQRFLQENARYISAATDGVIRLRSGIVEPTIIEKPLIEGGNFTEQFSPIFFVQSYDSDADLGRYFEDPRYKTNAMYVTLYGDSPYVESLVGDASTGKALHDNTNIIRNTDLHAPGIERGTKPYGGYGKGASSISIDGFNVAKPTLPQRDLYEYLVKPQLEVGVGSVSKRTDRMANQRSQTDRHESNRHWGERIADEILEKFPDRGQYIIAAGASPSHTVHFGNLRDVMTSLAVVKELQRRGKDAPLLFSWDNFEPLKDIPPGLNPSFEKFVGMPLSRIPDPFGKEVSYARHFEVEFERAMVALGVKITFSSQTDRYASGVYDSRILDALRQRREHAEIMLGHMPEEERIKRMVEPDQYRRDYYPIVVYSRFTGKANTVVLDFDGDRSVTYKCLDTGRTETVDLTRDRIAKLKWKVEWPIRWKVHGIVFEPGGIAESGRGGNHDVAAIISRKILGNDTPIYQRYGQVKLTGKNDDVSDETAAASILRLLKIYEPEVLKWLYLQRKPEQDFSISFNTDVVKQYSEFDDSVRGCPDDAVASTQKRMPEWMRFDPSERGSLRPIPFKQIVALGQTVGWNYEKLIELLDLMGLTYDPSSIQSRLSKARTWIECYNSDEAMHVLETPNQEYSAGMDSISRANILALRKALLADTNDLKELEKLTILQQDSEISPSANRERQRNFYKDIYQLLLGKNSGPRLATLLWAMDREKVLTLLNI